MKFNANEFIRCSEAHANSIADWVYTPPYSLYNINSPADRQALVISMSEPNNQYYVSLDQKGVVRAYYCFGEEATVRGGDYNTEALDIGGGLRPDITGHGYGEEFLHAGLILAQGLFSPTYFRMTIAAFNARAQKVATKLGFIEQERFVRPEDDRGFVVMLKASKA